MQAVVRGPRGISQKSRTAARAKDPNRQRRGGGGGGGVVVEKPMSEEILEKGSLAGREPPPPSYIHMDKANGRTDTTMEYGTGKDVHGVAAAVAVAGAG